MRIISYGGFALLMLLLGGVSAAQAQTGRAPTQEEVKQAIEKFQKEFYLAYNGNKAYVASWDSPIVILGGRKDEVNTDPGGDRMMYPVKLAQYRGGALGSTKMLSVSGSITRLRITRRQRVQPMDKTHAVDGLRDRLLHPFQQRAGLRLKESLQPGPCRALLHG